VQRWQVEPAELLEGLGLTQEDLTQPDRRLEIPVFAEVIRRARALTGEPALGIYFGLDMRVSSHGLLGYAALTSATVRAGLNLAIRYVPTRTTAISLRIVEGTDTAALVIDENADLGDARDAVLFALTMGIWQIAKAATGSPVGGEADFPFPRPEYIDRFAHFMPGGLRFDQPVAQLVFARELLDLPMTMSDPAAMQVAREHCERELQALGFGGDIVSRVRGVLQVPAAASGEAQGYRTLEEVSRALHMSERTLKRRLATQGTSFTSVLDDARCERAMVWLREDTSSHADIAERLGYADASAFSRAFRRWTGMTPAAFQRQGRG
jgi:AraC-like DNA-binding protein